MAPRQFSFQMGIKSSILVTTLFLICLNTFNLGIFSALEPKIVKGHYKYNFVVREAQVHQNGWIFSNFLEIHVPIFGTRWRLRVKYILSRKFIRLVNFPKICWFKIHQLMIEEIRITQSQIKIAVQDSKSPGQMSLSSTLFCYNTDQKFRWIQFCFPILVDTKSRLKYFSFVFVCVPCFYISYLTFDFVDQTRVARRSLGSLQLHQSWQRISGLFNVVSHLWLFTQSICFDCYTHFKSQPWSY